MFLSKLLSWEISLLKSGYWEFRYCRMNFYSKKIGKHMIFNPLGAPQPKKISAQFAWPWDCFLDQGGLVWKCASITVIKRARRGTSKPAMDNICPRPLMHWSVPNRQPDNANEMRLFLFIVLLYILGIRLSMPSQLPHCSRPYDCTARENHLVSHFSRVPSFLACAAKCRDEAQCEHFTYNMNRHGHYPGACYLFASCSVQRPSNGQWVSAAKSCISPTTSLPRHLRDRASRDRLQLATRSQ